MNKRGSQSLDTTAKVVSRWNLNLYCSGLPLSCLKGFSVRLRTLISYQLYTDFLAPCT